MTLTICPSKRFGELEGREASKLVTFFVGSRIQHLNSAVEEAFGVVL